jgi:hypothetical protein
MVVIAILLIVAFLLLPTFSLGRQSLTIRCLNNERQIAIMILLYADEHGHGYPNFDGVAGNDGPTALSLITNYLRQPKTFMCPFVIERGEEKRRRNSNDALPELNAAFVAPTAAIMPITTV